ncbi:MAG TPA: sodium-dependent bicarbonate transport family permease [Fimbriimonadaceae bacterium]|nr:sodium-dependent bicarbonate transport family permease [Fimbriimonadaceae bacterium]
MGTLELLSANLLSPMVLAFALGALATLLKSDLKLPEGLYTSLTIYLLFAIGLKGGVALSESSVVELWKPALATLVLGIATALTSYTVARRIFKLTRVDAAAMAAHYGSVSAVTFIAAIAFAESQKVQVEGFLPALVAILEIPAILLALVMASKKQAGSYGALVRELLTGKTILLLLGGLLIGLVSGKQGVSQVQPLFGDLFRGALTIFLLEMGLVAAQRFQDLKKHALLLCLFGTLMPVLNGTIGVLAGLAAGMSPGGAGVLGAMASSASYIAAPAVIRVSLPEANPSLYLTAPLAVTFPFNLAFGIPLFHLMALGIKPA